ncbi:MAG TPA: RidA family protein [Burkholderiales bacterium]|jgi:2-iminobutanoate/2-iminopropanoate deaminase
MALTYLNFPDAPPPPPSAAYSHAVAAGGFLFVTGQLGVDPRTGQVVPGGTAAEMRQVMKNLEVVLRNAGVMFAQVTMARIFLVDFKTDYPVVNKIYAEYFAAGRYPARTTVGVTGLALGCRVEVDLIAKL